MKLLLNTWCAHPDYTVRRYGYVDLTPELAELILTRANLFAEAQERNQDLFCMKFWDYSVRYFEPLPGSMSEEARKVLEDHQENFVETQEAIADKSFERIDSRTMEINANSVSWSAILLVWNIEIGTREVGLEKVREIAALSKKNQSVLSCS